MFTGRKLDVILEKSKSKIKCLQLLVRILYSHWRWKRGQRQPVSDSGIGRFYLLLRLQTNITALWMGTYILHKAPLIAGLILPSLLVIQFLHRQSHISLGWTLYDFWVLQSCLCIFLYNGHVRKELLSLSYWWGSKFQSNKDLDILTYFNTLFGSLKLCRYLKLHQVLQESFPVCCHLYASSISEWKISLSPPYALVSMGRKSVVEVEPWSATTLQFELGQREVERTF